MNTDAGEIVTAEVFALNKLTVTPPVGATTDNVTGKETDWPGATRTLDGRPIDPKFACGVTVTEAAPLETLVALALMVVEPALTPVIGTLTLVALAAMETVAGTVAKAVLLEVRLTVSPPAGAWPPDKFKVKLCVEPAETLNEFGEKLRLSLEFATVTLAEAVL